MVEVGPLGYFELLAVFALEILLKFFRSDKLISKSADPLNDRFDDFYSIIADFDLLKPESVDVAQRPNQLVRPANDAGGKADARV